MMLERGVYLAPSQYEAGFTSLGIIIIPSSLSLSISSLSSLLAHTEEDIDKTIAIAREVMSKL